MSTIKTLTNTRTPSLSVYSELNPPINKEFSLEIPDIPTSSVNLERPSDSWRFKSECLTVQEKKSFTDYAIVHNRTNSTDRTLSSVCENRTENENRESLELKPVARQRTDFSFGKQGTYSHFSDKTLETHFSNTDNFAEVRLSTKMFKPKYQRPANPAEFKPSNLFVMTEKLSKAMKDIKTMENNDRIKEVMEPVPSENSQEAEPKKQKEKGNLMSLIKDYTKNPNLDLKIKMNKTSFITSKKMNSDNKENTLENPSLEKTPNPFRKSSKLHDLLEAAKDGIQNHCFASASKSSGKKENPNLNLRGTLSAIKGNNRMSEIEKRSNSGEKNEPKKLNQSSQENSTLYGSHRRSLSCGKRRSVVSLTSNVSSFLFVNEVVSGTTTMRKEHEQVILTLNDTLQKLLRRTEANREEISKLKEINQEKTLILQLHQTKLQQFVQQNINRAIVHYEKEQPERKSTILDEYNSTLLKTLRQNDQKARKQEDPIAEQALGQLDLKAKELENVLSQRTEELNKFRKILNNLQQQEIITNNKSLHKQRHCKSQN